jgi:hypothetical protein
MTSWEGDEVEPTTPNPRRGMPGGIRRRKLWGAAGVAAVAAGLALNWRRSDHAGRPALRGDVCSGAPHGPAAARRVLGRQSRRRPSAHTETPPHDGVQP